MYNEEFENESCETIQRRMVVVVTRERYFSFREPVYVSDHGNWKEPYAYYDTIEINGKNKYVANLIKPFKDLDDIHIAYREISNQTGEYNIEPLEDIIGEYYLIYDSLRNDYHNKIKIPYHLNESAIFEKFLNSDESIFSITFEKTDYHKEKVVVNAKDLFRSITEQLEVIKSKYEDDTQKTDKQSDVKGEQGIAGDPKVPSSEETNEVEESDKKQEKSDSSTLLQSLTLMKIEPIKSTDRFIDKALKFIDNRFFVYMTKDGDSISDIKTIDEITGLLITYNYDDVDKLYWDFYLSILCGDTYYYSESENSYKIQTLDYELTGSIAKVSIDDKLVSVFFKITDYKPIFQTLDDIPKNSIDVQNIIMLEKTNCFIDEILTSNDIHISKIDFITGGKFVNIKDIMNMIDVTLDTSMVLMYDINEVKNNLKSEIFEPGNYWGDTFNSNNSFKINTYEYTVYGRVYSFDVDINHISISFEISRFIIN